MLQINTENFATGVKLLKYLDTTEDFVLNLPFDNPPLPLIAYYDASWDLDPFDRHSWTGYFIFLNRATVVWRVIKQSCVALSPLESEFIAASGVAKDIKYLFNTVIF